MPTGLVRRAWAKLNLFLEVTGRRRDGYHELDSLIVFAGTGDRLAFFPAKDLTLEITGPHGAALSAGGDNLVMAAARALREAAGETPGARIVLDKQIPVAAGVGGGSADAAAALDGLNQLWHLKLGEARLRDLGIVLGADVPVCLFGRPALVRGSGEIIRRAPPLPPAWLVMANPGIALATRSVFEARSDAFSEPRDWPADIGTLSDLVVALEQRRNDLESPARSLVPEIDRVLAALAQLPGARLTRMSGSGATCFAMFTTADEARRGADILSRREPGWWVAAAPLLHGKVAAGWRDAGGAEEG